MPVIQVEQSIGAGAAVTNLVSGSAFEFARGRQALSLGVNAAATGSFITIQSGGDVILEESPPYVATLFPIVPDQMFYNDIMENGDRLRISARNPTGGSIIHRVMAIVTPI